MKTIVLFPTIGLPIPSINGGAVEALITDLIDQNEIHKLYNFIVVSGWSEGVEEIQSKYKCSTFIVIKKRFYDEAFYLDRYDEYICHHCYEREVGEREDCGEVLYLSDLMEKDGKYFCPTCFDKLQEEDEEEEN